MKLQDKFQDIVAALQNELQEYGGLLHLFDRQQKCIVHQDPTGFLDINVFVDEQIANIDWQSAPSCTLHISKLGRARRMTQN